METVEEGQKVIEWIIRREPCAEDELKYFKEGYRYDYIIDDGRGDYSESEMFFESLEEAKAELGV